MDSGSSGDTGVNVRQQIAEIEAKIETLAETAERCRKFMQISQIAIVLGLGLLGALALRLIGFDPVAMVAGITATVGGVVALGSNSSTLKQAEAGMQAAEALRRDLIGQVGLRLVSDRREP